VIRIQKHGSDSVSEAPEVVPHGIGFSPSSPRAEAHASDQRASGRNAW
jgi:hypothetical protein